MTKNTKMLQEKKIHRKWRLLRCSRTGVLIVIIMTNVIAQISMVRCSPIKVTANDSSKDHSSSEVDGSKPTRLDSDESELVQVDDLTNANTKSNSRSQTVQRPVISSYFEPSSNSFINLLDFHQDQQNIREHVAQPYGDNPKRNARSIEGGILDNDESNDGYSDFITEPIDEQLDPAIDPQKSLMRSASLGQLHEKHLAEADLANQLALEEQQKKQDQMQSAQAQHVAKAIEDQQAALSRQHDVLMSQQLDEALNDSDNDRAWRRSLNVDTSDRGTNGNSIPSSESIQFSDHSESKIPSASNLNELDDDEGDGDDYLPNKNKPKINNDLFYDDSESAETTISAGKYADLIPAGQHHHYGSHYGSLHKHQSKYYQSVESHKKGQYKYDFKRGNKKFLISGHGQQHKSHVSGHVKWHSKKGKGSHHWDYQHHDKKHHHKHY